MTLGIGPWAEPPAASAWETREIDANPIRNISIRLPCASPVTHGDSSNRTHPAKMKTSVTQDRR